MNLYTLLVEEEIKKSNKLLESISKDLLPEQKTVVEGIYKEMLPLIEASLTADQIRSIFGAVEKQAVAGGQSRTLAGKGIDTAKNANEIINNVGKWLQNTTPVKAFDQKFDDLKNKINTKFPDSKILDGVSNLGIWVKENPGKSAAVIGVLTAIAALAAGPVGGAIAGQVLRGSAELLKGEKLSTAIGKGIKTAAIGWLAGMTMDAVGDMISDVYQQFNPIPIKGNVSYQVINVGNGLPSTFQDAAVYGSQEQLDQFKKLWKYAVDNWNNGDYAAAEQAFESAREFAEQVSTETMNKIALEGDPTEKIQALNQALNGFAAAAQGAAAGATAYDKQGKPVEGSTPIKQESYYLQTRPLSEGQVYMLFNRIEQLDEAGIMGKVKSGAAWVGKQATERVTSAKLLAAWKLEGSPTDSEAFKKFLINFGGIDRSVIDQIYADMKISAGDSAADQTQAAEKTQTVYAQVKSQINQLNTKQRQQLAAMLQKQLGTA
jgi:hypothetical protein